MASVDEEVPVARQVATLRALVNSLLDEGRQPDDPLLVASSLVLSSKLAALRRHLSELGR